MNYNKLYLTPGERSGFLMLTLLIIMSHSGILIYENVYGYTQEEKQHILNQIMAQDSILKIKRITKKQSHSVPPDVLNKFNPNTIDTAYLSFYGISQKAKQNLEKYRLSGGTFYFKEDLLKIYSLDTSVFDKIFSLINLPSRQDRKIAKHTEASFNGTNNKFLPPQSEPILDQPFDPNQIDRQTLINYGFTDFAAENLIKYKARGGSIKKDSDLLKIYGVDSLLFRRLSPLIHIPINAADEIFPSGNHNEALTEVINLEKPIQLDINNASVSELQSIKGVGPYISNAIVEYREKLGGYYALEQLLEIYALRETTYNEIKDQLIVTGPVQKIYAPDYTFKEILRHPYIDYPTTQMLKNIPLTEFDEQLKLLVAEGRIEDRLLRYLYLEDPHRKNME